MTISVHAGDLQRLADFLGLQPLPGEGGLYRQTYRSREELSPQVLPGRSPRPHAFGTAILYLLTDALDSFSALHRLPSDEIYHFYLGDPVQLLLLHPHGCQEVLLGHDLFAGQQVQFIVPAGTWQGARLQEGGRFALLGTTMAPGFEYQDYEPGDRQLLLAEYPAHADLIRRLTRLATP